MRAWVVGHLEKTDLGVTLLCRTAQCGRTNAPADCGGGGLELEAWKMWDVGFWRRFFRKAFWRG